MKVLIINQGASNKGDRAILTFMLDELLANGIEDITVSTTNRKLWQRCRTPSGVNIRFIPSGWRIHTGTMLGRAGVLLDRLRGRFYFNRFYATARNILLRGRSSRFERVLCQRYNPALWKAMTSADLILSVGGHHLTTLLKRDAVCHQTEDMTLAVISGKPLTLWSQSIGPFVIRAPENTLHVKKILESAHRVYIRDTASKEALQSVGAQSVRLYETPDSVFGLSRLARSSAVPPLKRDALMGISIYTGKASRQVANDIYIKSLAALIAHAADKGYRVRFFPMHLADRYEQRMIDEIISCSERTDACSVLESTTEIAEHIEEVSKCRVFIGHKTHSVVFSLMACVPLIAIAYHPKTLDFMRQFGLEEYGLEESETSPARLVSLFEHLTPRLDDVYARQREISRRLDEQVRSDFAHMLRSVNRRSE